ncbi:hypothetical protein NE237_022968 [Protea cynaroides]|uniref:Sec-independent protein translocase protein TatB n=1 Tax=Protea cynaroides TaxID=273540 RepID=A0A9Q0HC00_9MAGN|nr:hypothetical protein NE237_022968 [Protea cynaroides]
MFGISYGELFLLLGATAALIGPRDLPIIARTAGKLAGRAIGYIQLARGQLENVLYISIINPGPLTRRLMDNPELTSTGSVSADLHSQATIYDRLAATPALRTGSSNSVGDAEKLNDEVSNFNILPVSAETAGLLPNCKDHTKGSDIVLEAIIEAEVAHNAKHFFAQHENQIPRE